MTEDRLYECAKKAVDWYFADYLDNSTDSLLKRQWNMLPSPFCIEMGTLRMTIVDHFLSDPTHIILTDNNASIIDYRRSVSHDA